MERHKSTHKNLGFSLALALGLGLSGAAAAAPADQDTGPQEFEGLDLQQVPAELLEPFADMLATQAQANQAMAGTNTVQNCSDSGTGSLRTAVSAASSGDTIDLSQLSCSNITLTSGEIPITVNNLTIKGKGDTGGFYSPEPTINAQFGSRVFKHTGTGTLNLRDLTVQYGFIDQSTLGTNQVFGGCVYSGGTVHLYGVVVYNCEAQSTYMAHGGGVYAKTGIVLHDGTWILGNKVTAALYAKGGGLYSGGAVATYSQSLVNSNSATVTSNGFARGGGIYADGFLGGGLRLEHNTAKQTSGASAQAVSGGGAYFYGAVALGTSTINDNHAEGPGSQGGGLYIKKSANIGGTITNNDAVDDGGGLYFEDTATVSSSTVSDNTSGDNGGGIYADGKLTLKESTVADNAADGLGGGIYAASGLTSEDSNITGNHSDTNGGGIRAFDKVTIKGSTIADNTAANVAGMALSGNPSSASTLDQSTISGNQSSSSNYGAGLFLAHDTVIRNSTITENTVHNTSETKYGAGIALSTGVQLTLSSTIVSNNYLYVANSGGGIPVWLKAPDDIGKASGAGSVYNITGSHNLINYSAVTVPADTIADVADLKALDDNGGLTLTHMPEVDSLAIDNGKDNGFSCDQRGGGYSRVAGFAADIGAVEVQDDENTDRIFANGFEAAPTSCN